MFKKIATGAVMDYKILDTQIAFDLTSDGKKIQYFNVHSEYLNKFIASLGDFSKHFYTSFVMIEADVPPHTDIVDSVSLNFYLEAGDYRTVFYNSKENSSREVYADHGDGHTYKIDELDEIGSFTATSGDIYLLNGKIIHGVSSNTSDKSVRKFLQVSTNDLTYDEVLTILRTAC